RPARCQQRADDEVEHPHVVRGARHPYVVADERGDEDHDHHAWLGEREQVGGDLPATPGDGGDDQLGGHLTEPRRPARTVGESDGYVAAAFVVPIGFTDRSDRLAPWGRVMGTWRLRSSSRLDSPTAPTGSHRGGECWGRGGGVRRHDLIRARD